MAGKAEFGEVDEIVGTLIDGLGPSLRSRPMPSVKPALFDEEDMQTIGQFRVASPLLQQVILAGGSGHHLTNEAASLVEAVVAVARLLFDIEDDHVRHRTEHRIVLKANSGFADSVEMRMGSRQGGRKKPFEILSYEAVTSGRRRHLDWKPIDQFPPAALPSKTGLKTVQKVDEGLLVEPCLVPPFQIFDCTHRVKTSAGPERPLGPYEHACAPVRRIDAAPGTPCRD